MHPLPSPWPHHFIQYLALGIQKGIPSFSLVSYWALLFLQVGFSGSLKVSPYKMVGPRVPQTTKGLWVLTIGIFMYLYVFLGFAGGASWE